MDSSNTKDTGAIPKTTNLATTTVDKGDGYSTTCSAKRKAPDKETMQNGGNINSLNVHQLGKY